VTWSSVSNVNDEKEKSAGGNVGGDAFSVDDWMSCTFFVKNADISVALRDDLSFTFDDDLPEILSIDFQRRRGLVGELILFIQNARLFLSAVRCCVFNAVVHAVHWCKIFTFVNYICEVIILISIDFSERLLWMRYNPMPDGACSDCMMNARLKCTYNYYIRWLQKLHVGVYAICR